MSSLSDAQWNNFRSYFTSTHTPEELVQYDVEKGRKSNIRHFFWDNKPDHVADLLKHCAQLHDELARRDKSSEKLRNLEENMACMLNYLVEETPACVEDEKIAEIFQKMNTLRHPKPMEPDVILAWCKTAKFAKESDTEPPAMPTCWKIYGTREEIADKEAVKKLYIQHSKLFHPDKLKANDPDKDLKQEAFKLVDTAYKEICNIKRWH